MCAFARGRAIAHGACDLPGPGRRDGRAALHGGGSRRRIGLRECAGRACGASMPVPVAPLP